MSIGDQPTASTFSSELTGGVASLWGFDSQRGKWYYYSPAPDAMGGSALSDYLTRCGYLDLRSSRLTLKPGMGLWIKK